MSEAGSVDGGGRMSAIGRGLDLPVSLKKGSSSPSFIRTWPVISLNNSIASFIDGFSSGKAVFQNRDGMGRGDRSI